MPVPEYLCFARVLWLKPSCREHRGPVGPPLWCREEVMPNSLGTALQLPLNASLQNLVRRNKDPLCVAFRNPAALEPVLNVSTAVVVTIHSQRFETQQRNGFGLDFFEISRQGFGIVN